MATTNDLKNGLVLKIDGQLWSVVEFQHVKPGKGGAFVRTKLKNVLSGKVVDKTFNAGVKVETATVDRRTMQFLYREGTDCVFMDNESYEQLHVPGRDRRATRRTSCSRARTPSWRRTRARRSTSSCPAAVELTIEYTEPGMQGDRSTGGTKPARLETGYEIARPAVHHVRREGQGRHAHRRLPRPRHLVTLPVPGALR